jgi:DNA primase
MSIPPHFIQELLARADIVEIVGRYVPLKKGGANFMGLCPFHAEKSPSFSVNPVKQFFHCFGCGKSGDSIRFLMEHVGMTFVEAVKELAQQYGMQVPEERATPEERARIQFQREKRDTLTEVLEKAAQAYQRRLKESSTAVEYLKGRGLSGQIAKQFGLGYAPAGWNNLASVFPHYDDPLLVESGLVIQHESEERHYDRFRDRVMFPIRNIKGECIGFGGRVLGDAKPKYLNSPETPVFSKGHELYGLFEARNAIRERGYVLVTEGYMDVVALAQWGFPNAVATLGTACTAEHMQKLFRFTENIVFSFDGDAAGQRAAHKALRIALPYATDVRTIKFLFLPEEHDPDSFIRAQGTDAFSDCVKQATPLSRFVIEVAQEDCDVETAEGRAHRARNAKLLFKEMPQGELKRLLEKEMGFVPSRSYIRPTQRPALPLVKSMKRADHAVRILLRHIHLWEILSNDAHDLLCELPPPYGDLFIWIGDQLSAEEPQPWGVLQETLQESDDTADILQLAHRLMVDEFVSEKADDAEKELRDSLNRMMLEKLKEQEREYLAASDVTHYKTCHEQRLLLQKRINDNLGS